jgi:hypothetical protein
MVSWWAGMVQKCSGRFMQSVDDNPTRVGFCRCALVSGTLWRPSIVEVSILLDGQGHPTIGDLGSS